MDRYKTRVEMEEAFTLRELKLFFPILYDPDNPFRKAMLRHGKAQETEAAPAPEIGDEISAAARHTPVLRHCSWCDCENWAVFEDSELLCEWCHQKFGGEVQPLRGGDAAGAWRAIRDFIKQHSP